MVMLSTASPENSSDLISRAVRADLADQVQDQVFGVDALLETRRSTSTFTVSGTRNQVLPRPMAMATSEEPMPVAKAPSPPAVTVWESAPDDDVTGPGVGFSHDLVADAFAHVGELDPGLRGKLAQEHVVVGERRLRAGGGVVHEQNGLFRIGRFFDAAIQELAQGQRTGGILDKDQVDFGNHDIPGPGIRS